MKGKYRVLERNCVLNLIYERNEIHQKAVAFIKVLSFASLFV